MDEHAAKTYLSEEYQAAGLELLGEGAEGLLFRYQERTFLLADEDVQDYAAQSDFLDGLQVGEDECSLVSPTYREQIVQPLDPMRWRYLPPLELGFIFGDPEQEDTYVTLGAASLKFVNYFRFDPLYLNICLERMAHAPDVDEPLDLRRGFYRPPTIKVHKLAEKSVKQALAESDQVIDYCLFELAYLKHLPVGLAREWPARRRMEDDDFKFVPDMDGSTLPLPRAQFDRDILRFYQLGMSIRVPVLQFWSYYQVLEHFFVDTSDAQLHAQLASRLNDPRFRPTGTQLDRLMQDVLDHVAETDDVEMLRRVIEKYVLAEELIAFIKAYEEYLGEPHYTRRRRVFGEDIQVKLDAEQVIDSIARTVMAIRQVLMYSSDRFSRTARSLSYTQISDAIAPEIPMMKFLAERVIIGSAT